MTEAQKRANKKHLQAHYTSKSIKIKKHKNLILQEYLKNNNTSFNKLINQFLDVILTNNKEI